MVLITLISFLFFACEEQQNQPKPDSPLLEDKIGQMLMVGFNGFEVSDTSHVIRDIREYNVGGIILFDYNMTTRTPNRNIESPEQVRSLTSSLTELATTPLFIAIDQEGGRVARLKPERNFVNHVSAENLGEINNPDTTRYYASSMADQLQSLGFNVNFAPVVDLNTNPDNPVIGQLDRSFSADPAIVVEHAKIFLEEFANQQILGVLKHFPGHGSAWNDSHLGMADVTDTWDSIELEPYRELVTVDAPFAVMTAHVLNKNLDPDLPATLSSKAQTDMLRNDIGFSGVLFSDDMQMEAIRSFYGLEKAIELAINAGVDVLVFANNSVYQPDIVPEAVAIIKKLVENEIIPEERINESYQRIQNAKMNLSVNMN